MEMERSQGNREEAEACRGRLGIENDLNE